MKNTIFLSEALNEMIEAAQFYETQSPGLGQDFLLEIYSVKEKITKSPMIWAELEPGIRRCLATKFPYALLYHIDEEDITMTSVMHLKRRPNYWRERLRKRKRRGNQNSYNN
ncbi:MAG: hypothetical protein WC637_18495 [Victivallales bacterium]|jgi:hypothetical protein